MTTKIKKMSISVLCAIVLFSPLAVLISSGEDLKWCFSIWILMIFLTSLAVLLAYVVFVAAIAWYDWVRDDESVPTGKHDWF